MMRTFRKDNMFGKREKNKKNKRLKGLSVAFLLDNNWSVESEAC
jgi:hypothetical protein